MTSPLGGLPPAFCWSKFGTEAGDDIAAIRARKEDERGTAGGRFYWGIGGSVGQSVAALVASGCSPEVLFTPMLSKPAAVDVAPVEVATWSGGLGLDGMYHSLLGGVVTSRVTPGRRRRHYALVCESDERIDIDGPLLQFSRDSVVNLRSGAPVGSSQVTSVVRHLGPVARSTGIYTVAFRARLVPPYVVTLVEEPGRAVSTGRVRSSPDGAISQDLLWA